jgi:hypothetical protein
MQGIALVEESRPGQVFGKDGPGSLIAQAVAPLAIEQEQLVGLPLPQPALQCSTSIIAEVHHPAHPRFSRLIDRNPSLPQVHIRNHGIQELPNPHPGPEQHQDHGPIPDGINDCE